jgi:hypothetical protein
MCNAILCDAVEKEALKAALNSCSSRRKNKKAKKRKRRLSVTPSWRLRCSLVKCGWVEEKMGDIDDGVPEFHDLRLCLSGTLTGLVITSSPNGTVCMHIRYTSELINDTDSLLDS